MTPPLSSVEQTRRDRWGSRFVSSILFVVVMTFAHGDARAQTTSRHLACARGDLSVCQALADQLRIAPGIREAAKQLITEVQDGITRCDRGEVDACAELLERYPDLPTPVRASLAETIARTKQK